MADAVAVAASDAMAQRETAAGDVAGFSGKANAEAAKLVEKDVGIEVPERGGLSKPAQPLDDKNAKGEKNDSHEPSKDDAAAALLAQFRETAAGEWDEAVDPSEIELSTKTLDSEAVLERFREAVASENGLTGEDAQDEDWGDIELSEKTIELNSGKTTLMSSDVPGLDEDDQDEADWDAESADFANKESSSESYIKQNALRPTEEPAALADAENQKTAGNSQSTTSPLSSIKRKLENNVEKVVHFNIGGKMIASTMETIGRVDWLLAAYARGEETCLRDEDGHMFVDQNPEFAQVCMRILRSSRKDLIEATRATLPKIPDYGSEAFQEMLDSARHLRFEPVLVVLREEALANVDQDTANVVRGLEAEKESLLKKMSKAGKMKEKMRIEVRRIELEISKALILNKDRKSHWSDPAHAPELSFNLIIVGNSGAGKSSTMQTILNSADVCKVSGGQAQGTRGTYLRDGRVDGHLMSYIDTQGLGADTCVTDVELLEQIMLSTNAINRMQVISNVLMAMDLRERATPAIVGNYLTFTELFQELQSTCFLCFTKWNSNNVMAEWNKPLYKWRRRWRKASSIEEITEEPPSYAELYEAYTVYLTDALAGDSEDTAFAKLVSVLAFFDSRIVWAFNLDAEQQEQRAEGTLEPYIEVMYRYYRTEAIGVLEKGRHVVPTVEMQFLRHDRDTLKKLAFDLIQHRNEHLGLLEDAARDRQRRQRLGRILTEMSKKVTHKLARRNYSDSEYVQQVAGVVGVARKTMSFGCSLS
ncbi:SH3KBP1-binding protein 1 [Hondaea fermentalgiana]|uniref:SH3KBP1-binding protein 1 n=1 Tax=Hondaea fermentalgiana TaxID=2315210 RepID=A0A2R5H1Y0_9STRA|nr:SH3KBP1-binding protein 1 [Hondaea fermentalgiana]|eukprot:GBG34831.1 SH3KBP1-binding protein 1 [Hondaea fermentalgiana]